MLSKIRYINRLKFNNNDKKYICNISLKDNSKILNKNLNKDIQIIMRDVKIIKNEYKNISDYNLMKLLLNYNTYDNKYNVEDIIKQIKVLKEELQFTDKQVLEILSIIQYKNYMNNKQMENHIENISYIGILCGLGIIIAII